MEEKKQALLAEEIAENAEEQAVVDITQKIEVGMTREASFILGFNRTAQAMGSGTLPVLATPAMVGLMEQAATELVQQLLPPGYTSVGTALCISHTASSPVGAQIHAIATVTAVEGKKITYKVEAFDGKGGIGAGTHERIIVPTEKFLFKAQGKLNKK